MNVHRTQFAVGDRVRISHAAHPWYGWTGTISKPFHEQGLDWIVAIENCNCTSGCADNHLRLVEKAVDR